MPGHSLTAADGAVFHVLIEEMTDGQWRVSGQVKLDQKSHVDVQTSDIQMCQSEGKAREWANAAAKARGFTRFGLDVIRQPESKK